MELLANELSIHEQFNNVEELRLALTRLMQLRSVANRFDRDIHSNRYFLTTNPIPGVPLQKAIGHLHEKNQIRALMAWLSKRGPFWDDLRFHNSNEYFECQDNVVTDSSVGEAGFRSLKEIDCGLVSLTPSNWNSSPVEVTWLRDSEQFEDQTATVENFWLESKLEEKLQLIAPPICTWEGLEGFLTSRFNRLIFADDCFEPLFGVPFQKSAAERFQVLLGILNDLANSFEEDGARSNAGHILYELYFTGDRALFSDSSATEKQRFRQQLTFVHPESKRRKLFCTWHGKISYETLRIHFSWPIRSGKPVYVVYAGPKITRT